MKKEKTPEELAAYQAKRAAQRRQWAIDHPEKTRAYGRAFYRRNPEKCRASSNLYNQTHREQRRAYDYAYYRRKKAENPNYVKELTDRARARRIAQGWQPKPVSKYATEEERKLARQRRYRENRLQICRKTLTEYAYKSMARVQERASGRIQQYLEAYPFETCGHKLILSVLYRHFSVYPGRAEYDDCYEAGMLAYLYSIHRCADLECDYTVPYIRKLVRIYISCALVVYNEAREICTQNNLRMIQLDADPSGRRY